MSGYEMSHEGDLMVAEQELAAKVASLPFGRGEMQVGLDDHFTPEETPQVMGEASTATVEHGEEGHVSCFDCMDGRKTLAILYGLGESQTEVTDATNIAERKVGQLAGGTVLAFTKAALAANAAFLRDAKTFVEAYDLTSQVLAGLGVQDAAHEGCGASKLVAKSVLEPLPAATIAAAADAPEAQVQLLADNKAARYTPEFLEGWSPEVHKQKVLASGGAYSVLETMDDPQHGHHEGGLLVVPEGKVFAKNKFIDATGGKQLFVLTLAEADKVADKLGMSDEERELIKLGLRDDSFNVANHIVAEGLDVYA